MHIFIPLCVLSSITLIVGESYDCKYNAREYQVVLKPEILSEAHSFAYGVSLVLDELEAIEKAAFLDFEVSRSSLKIKDVNVALYSAQRPKDLNTRILMKSRQKKPDEAGDFVLKFSNPDPTLACVDLRPDNMYAEHAVRKFELDLHVVNGKIMTKSALSYTVDMPQSARFTQTIPVNLSSIFLDSTQKLTQSGRAIIAQPTGHSIQQTAEFNIRLADAKTKGVITLIERDGIVRSEFSFRLKGDHFGKELLSAAQELASIMSRIPLIAKYADLPAECND